MDRKDLRTRDLASNMLADNLNVLLALYTFLKDLDRPFVSGLERSLLTRALRILMEHKGMDAQDASTWEANRLFLSDVYAVLAQELRQEDPVTVNIIVSTPMRPGSFDLTRRRWGIAGNLGVGPWGCDREGE